MKTILSLFLTILCLLNFGCSYHSTYEPPADARARAVWQGDKVVMYAPSTEAPVCRGGELAPDRDPRATPTGHWVPEEQQRRHHRASSVNVIVIAPLGHHHHSGHHGSTRGETKGDPRLLAVLAVGALIALPIVTVGLALGHPEPEDEVADEIDRINKYNDHARHAWRTCGLIDAKKGAK
jgi:hypothetical protein